MYSWKISGWWWLVHLAFRLTWFFVLSFSVLLYFENIFWINFSKISICNMFWQRSVEIRYLFGLDWIELDFKTKKDKSVGKLFLAMLQKIFLFNFRSFSFPFCGIKIHFEIMAIFIRFCVRNVKTENKNRCR